LHKLLRQYCKFDPIYYFVEDAMFEELQYRIRHRTHYGLPELDDIGLPIVNTGWGLAVELDDLMLKAAAKGLKLLHTDGRLYLKNPVFDLRSWSRLSVVLAIRCKYSYYQLSMYLSPIMKKYLCDDNVRSYNLHYYNMNRAIVRIDEDDLPSGKFAAALVR
jgi:hypothetical protein